MLAFGTDYPVEPVTPFRGLYAAVTRKSEDGTRIYYPEQAINIQQALYAYTQASSFAERMETKKGKLVRRAVCGLCCPRSGSYRNSASRDTEDTSVADSRWRQNGIQQIAQLWGSRSPSTLLMAENKT